MCAGLEGDGSVEVVWWEDKCLGTSGTYDLEPLQVGQGIAGCLGAVGSSTVSDFKGKLSQLRCELTKNYLPQVAYLTSSLIF
jgi:hypothetical protein